MQMALPILNNRLVRFVLDERDTIDFPPLLFSSAADRSFSEMETADNAVPTHV